MGEVQLQLFYEMLQHHHKTPKYFRSSGNELKGFFRVALKKKLSNVYIEEFQIFVVWQLGLIPGSRPWHASPSNSQATASELGQQQAGPSGRAAIFGEAEVSKNKFCIEFVFPM